MKCTYGTVVEVPRGWVARRGRRPRGARRNATTHNGAKADLAAQGAKVIDARVIDDGDLITGGGITAGLEVSLWLVEWFLGAKTTQRAEVVLEYERRGTVWRA
ncbi:hypothetical protein SD37_14090 [Amycolatopsis orientalis]|uniref:Uncharacterized protein n=1 Tax=Amycolatopsis orientalis TaxID=31958 RepID=A0A193BWS1_AMYOR|nr:hypothetical protein SD37_14090 [Amycolatopsis orientalis]